MDVGSRKGKDDKAPLSEIIDVLNERFGTNFTNAYKLFFDQVTEQAKADDDVRRKVHANLLDNFALSVDEKLLDVTIERMDGNAAIAAKLMNDPEFRRVAFREMARKIYAEVRGENSASG